MKIKHTNIIHNKIIIWIFMGLLSCLAGYFMQNSREPLALLVGIIYLISVISQPTDDYLYFVAIAIPNTRGLELAGISIAVWVCIIYLSLELLHHSISISKKMILINIFFVLFMMQLCLRFGDFSNGLIQPMKIVLVLMALYRYSNSRNSVIKSNEKIKTMMLLWIYGAMMAILPAFLGSSGGRISAFSNDSNTLAVEMVFLFSSLTILYAKGNISFKFIEYILAVIVSFLICLMAGSRMGLVLLAMFIVWFVILGMTGKNRMKAIGIVASICIIIVLGINSRIGQEYITFFSQRSALLLENNNYSNGRVDLWKSYISTFGSIPGGWLLGIGGYEQWGIEEMAHNLVIEDVASYGIIGITILVSAYAELFKNEKKQIILGKRTKVNVLCSFPFISIFIGGLTLHSMTSLPNTIMLYVSVALYYNFVERETKV